MSYTKKRLDPDTRQKRTAIELDKGLDCGGDMCYRVQCFLHPSTFYRKQQRWECEAMRLLEYGHEVYYIDRRDYWKSGFK